MSVSGARDCLEGGGELGALMRALDWSATAVGVPEQWTPALRTTVGLLLRNRFPMLLWWGPEHVQFYNDAYRPIPADKHPRCLGQRGADCWPEIWHVIGPMVRAPFRGEPATWADDLQLMIHRSGYPEETHFKVAYSPVPDESVPDTGVGGVLATVTEITAQVYGERQLRMLRELGARVADAKSAQQALATAAAVFAENRADVPFAALYSIDGAALRLVAGDDVLDEPTRARARDAAMRGEVAVLDDLPLAALSPWNAPVERALVLPLAADHGQCYGVMVAGASPHRRLDDDYRTFFELSAARVVTAIRNTRALEEARQRAEALAELDRAKTAFFSNVSHELRTPLTLMLAPTEDAVSSGSALAGETLAMVHRNELRLLKLVNTLLDFARIEAGRTEASYRETELAALTSDLASMFRAAIEKAGLRLVVNAPAAVAAFVDREMWEKIVLNLISNAFKHTFEGEITVSIRTRGEHVELAVSDTGVGIPDGELPHVFERFHRVRNARARSHEGSGIGLALVRDLVHLHAGRVTVTSRIDAGTTFTVEIPSGRAHLPADRVEAERALAATAPVSQAFVNEAWSWLPASAPVPPPTHGDRHARVLVADDNADMREYLARLLRAHWTVTTAVNGADALASARANPPDLVLADVMMPELDGLGLLAALRADAATSAIPVILVSARAGEEATADGLRAGADDYIVKPFTASSLLVRVEAQLAGARARKDNLETRRQLELALEEARTANRTKDDFLALLGHELRNPLAPIVTALELMEIRGYTNVAAECSVIERQTDHLMRLVDDLMDVARIARGKIELNLENIALAEVIAKAVELASPLFERKRHHLDLDVAPGLVIRGDRQRLAQVFSNLLVNAAKYTDAGGTVRVIARPSGERVVTAVSDSGIGISAEMLPHVFDMFVQEHQSVDRARGGLGLGLTLVKSLVMRHGGTVTAASGGTGQGSTFEVELPLLVGAAAVLSKRRVSRLPTMLARSRRILIVEDNEDAARTLATAISALGHEIRIASDGPAALDIARGFAPELALLDIGLPVMDGYQVGSRLRELDRMHDVRLVAVTGYGQPSDRSRSQALGFDAHLVKPVDLHHLSSLLEELLA